MKRKGLTYLIFTIVVLILIFVFRPVPIIEESEALVHKGVVEQILESGDHDISFILEDGRHFYINRGLEQGLNLDSLKNVLTGQELTFKYPDYWTPLDPNDSHKHLSQLEHEGRILYSEFKQD